MKYSNLRNLRRGNDGILIFAEVDISVRRLFRPARTETVTISSEKRLNSLSSLWWRVDTGEMLCPMEMEKAVLVYRSKKAGVGAAKEAGE